MPEKFEDRLRKARQDRGLSQVELADKTGFQPSAVSHFETGTRAPSFENLRRLADALDVSIDFLLGRQSESTATGPVADRLYRSFDKMTADDKEAITAMAEMFAKKSEAKRRNDKE